MEVGAMRGFERNVETVTAAASAIVQAENRVQQVTSPRRRSGGCLSNYWCFRFQKPARRIGPAAHVPDQAARPGSDQLPGHYRAAPPFLAPPPSPASLLQSGPHPPPDPAFVEGPYAHETQPVSPPVFSTEPSTAPLTPPAEPTAQLTTPASPEVPYARLLASCPESTAQIKIDGGEFQGYLLCPGSPIGHLVSPSSACSGGSSPLPFDLTAEELARRLAVDTGDAAASRDFKFHNADDDAPAAAAVSKKWAFFPLHQSAAT
ncbi:hydroxyproline-rich glycoprotein family protein isoform X2 [Wolffia australiana]